MNQFCKMHLLIVRVIKGNNMENKKMFEYQLTLENGQQFQYLIEGGLNFNYKDENGVELQSFITSAVFIRPVDKEEV